MFCTIIYNTSYAVYQVVCIVPGKVTELIEAAPFAEYLCSKYHLTM